METGRMKFGGAAIMWRISQLTSLSEVRDNLKREGLEEFCPEPRTDEACLKGALTEVFPTPDAKTVRHVVRPYKNGIKGFAVVAEQIDEQHGAGDDWGTVVAVAGYKDDGLQDLTLDPYDYTKEVDIQDKITAAKGWITAASVGKALSDLVEYLGGVALRPSGGVYWLNEDKLDQWARISDIFERASCKADGKEESHIYALKVVADEQMVRCVGDALTEEIEYAVSRIEDEIQNPDMTPQRCENRILKAGKLLEKVRRYEEAFSQPLAKLTDLVNKAAINAATASLQVSACSGAVSTL